MLENNNNVHEDDSGKEGVGIVENDGGSKILIKEEIEGAVGDFEKPTAAPKEEHEHEQELADVAIDIEEEA